jgi:hypothetical protein
MEGLGGCAGSAPSCLQSETRADENGPFMYLPFCLDLGSERTKALGAGHSAAAAFRRIVPPLH